VGGKVGESRKRGERALFSRWEGGGKGEGKKTGELVLEKKLKTRDQRS
jgi:hypothetical protein